MLTTNDAVILILNDRAQAGKEAWVAGMLDVLDVPQSRLADLVWDGMVAEPAGAGRVLASGQAGGERDAVLLDVRRGCRGPGR